MMINVDSFRDMFARYVFAGSSTGIPKLKIGWFEGGITWIPTALQDAEHVLRLVQHMLNHQTRARRPLLLGHAHVCVVHGRPARA